MAEQAIKKGDWVNVTNKLSGSEYDGEVIEVAPDQIKIVICDDWENPHKIPLKFWDVKKMERE